MAPGLEERKWAVRIGRGDLCATLALTPTSQLYILHSSTRPSLHQFLPLPLNLTLSRPSAHIPRPTYQTHNHAHVWHRRQLVLELRMSHCTPSPAHSTTRFNLTVPTLALFFSFFQTGQLGTLLFHSVLQCTCSPPLERFTFTTHPHWWSLLFLLLVPSSSTTISFVLYRRSGG